MRPWASPIQANGEHTKLHWGNWQSEKQWSPASGDETGSDFYRMMEIVLDSGYDGYVGIEYEGSVHSEMEGIRLTDELLKKIRDFVS